MTATAKIFRNGASQAVRLPKEFRFDVDEVCIKRLGRAVLIFKKSDAWDLMAHALGSADDDFLPDRNQPLRAEARKPLDGRRGRKK
jgi:antitoxin VapB